MNSLALASWLRKLAKWQEKAWEPLVMSKDIKLVTERRLVCASDFTCITNVEQKLRASQITSIHITFIFC